VLVDTIVLGSTRLSLVFASNLITVREGGKNSHQDTLLIRLHQSLAAPQRVLIRRRLSGGDPESMGKLRRKTAAQRARFDDEGRKRKGKPAGSAVLTAWDGAGIGAGAGTTGRVGAVMRWWGFGSRGVG
jgi:hypothetical protein